MVSRAAEGAALPPLFVSNANFIGGATSGALRACGGQCYGPSNFSACVWIRVDVFYRHRACGHQRPDRPRHRAAAGAVVGPQAPARRRRPGAGGAGGRRDVLFDVSRQRPDRAAAVRTRRDPQAARKFHHGRPRTARPDQGRKTRPADDSRGRVGVSGGNLSSRQAGRALRSPASARTQTSCMATATWPRRGSPTGARCETVWSIWKRSARNSRSRPGRRP